VALNPDPGIRNPATNDLSSGPVHCEVRIKSSCAKKPRVFVAMNNMTDVMDTSKHRSINKCIIICLKVLDKGQYRVRINSIDIGVSS
jgi:hypothetical protein